MKLNRWIYIGLLALVMGGCGYGGSGSSTDAPPSWEGEAVLQAALDELPHGGVLTIAPGVYRENLVVTGKVVHLQGAPGRTIIDGRGATCLTITNASGSSVTGLSFVNGEDGISTNSILTIEECSFTNNVDGVDYEGGGGLLEGNLFHGNRDDAVDLDQDTAVRIMDNLISASGDDGIEIRLHPHDGAALSIDIQNNTLTGNRANGIQLIDYEVDTHRNFDVSGNTFIENRFNAIAYADNQDTAPSYDIGEITESVTITDNRFYPANYAFTGSGPGTFFQGNTVFSRSGDGTLNTTGDIAVSDNVFIQLD